MWIPEFQLELGWLGFELKRPNFELGLPDFELVRLELGRFDVELLRFMLQTVVIVDKLRVLGFELEYLTLN
jgi:hypothetical protein